LFTIAGCSKSEKKEPTLGFPENSIITPSIPCGENFSCCITLCLESSEWHFEEKICCLSRSHDIALYDVVTFTLIKTEEGVQEDDDDEASKDDENEDTMGSCIW
jgi:hypothetical protein